MMIDEKGKKKTPVRIVADGNGIVGIFNMHGLLLLLSIVVCI